jgi:hypothetical protein
MFRLISLSIFLLFSLNLHSQAKVDLDQSVPLWMEYEANSNEATLNWIADSNASNYYVSKVSTFQSLIPLGTLEGSATDFFVGALSKGDIYSFHIRKDIAGRGIINVGIEIPAVHKRGRCLIAIDDILSLPLANEIDQLIEDIRMDGWQVDTLHISQEEEVVSVKSKVVEWYDENYENSQSLFLLGHIPVPYSGNSAHDGHGNHQGAWAADLFYGEVDGNWTDLFVNNTTPSREKNKNIPGDGKYDPTNNPSNLEIEVGRVDFNDLPAFPDDEIELTRQYLNKSHEFKVGNNQYPRRALVENNFSGFPEGFGQSAWRNFPAMFGGDSVTTQNYDVLLETDKYLCSYACGGGSYTSCSGVGTTSNLWVAKNIQTVFTLTFGSYFGDWDSQNNFLRSALGSGDVLVNAWAGRPAWQIFDMAIGKHIGYSAMKSQDASGSFYNQGNSPKSAHIALMGDPTLRLHPVKRAENLVANFDNGDVHLDWEASGDASHGHLIYRREIGAEWSLIAEVDSVNTFIDICLGSNTNYEYMVKALKLEYSGSGSYYNSSLGITTEVLTGENPLLTAYYPDSDMDGYGNFEGIVFECMIPPGFAENGLDCDDTNSDINPDGIEIPNNDIDEDCDGMDLLVGVDDIEGIDIKIYPNPTNGILYITGDIQDDWTYKLYNAQGLLIKSASLTNRINIENFDNGLYWLELNSDDKLRSIYKSIILIR